MSGGNSSSNRVGLSLLENALSMAVVASFLRSPCTSVPLEADLSKGEMFFGRGVRKSFVQEDDFVNDSILDKPFLA